MKASETVSDLSDEQRAQNRIIGDLRYQVDVLQDALNLCVATCNAWRMRSEPKSEPYKSEDFFPSDDVDDVREEDDPMGDWGEFVF